MSDVEPFGLADSPSDPADDVENQNQKKSSGPIQALAAAWGNANVWRIATLTLINSWAY